MTKKKLDTESIAQELGAVATFAQSGTSARGHSPTVASQKKTVPPRNRATTTPRNRATVQPRHRDTMQPLNPDGLIEAIRSAVREIGKEAATYRFTADEKKALADIVYTHKGQGVKTSENELTRIAVNFLIEEYKENGGNSVLEKVLLRLNA